MCAQQLRPDAIDRGEAPDRKRCQRCGRSKPVAAFCRMEAADDGRQRWCKACKRAVRADDRQREENRRSEAEYRARPEVAARRRETQLMRARRPEIVARHRVQQRARYASPRGKLLVALSHARGALARARTHEARERARTVIATCVDELARIDRQRQSEDVA